MCVRTQKLKDAGVEIPEAGGKAKNGTEEETKALKEEVRRLKDELDTTKKGMSQLAVTHLHPEHNDGKNDETHKHTHTQTVMKKAVMQKMRLCTMLPNCILQPDSRLCFIT